MVLLGLMAAESTVVLWVCSTWDLYNSGIASGSTQRGFSLVCDFSPGHRKSVVFGTGSPGDPELANANLVRQPETSVGREPLASIIEKWSLNTGKRGNIPSDSCLQQECLLGKGLPLEVWEVIQNARTSSTRTLYFFSQKYLSANVWWVTAHFTATLVLCFASFTVWKISIFHLPQSVFGCNFSLPYWDRANQAAMFQAHNLCKVSVGCILPITL